MIVTVCAAATTLVVMLNLALVCPTGTVTDAGVCAASLLPLCRVTTTPVKPLAAALKLTVPLTAFPPLTAVAFSRRPVKVADPGGTMVRVTGSETPA